MLFLYLPKLDFMNAFKIILPLLVFFSCNDTKTSVDLLVLNAKVYTVNEHFEMAQAFAIKDGKILEVGTSEELQEKYRSDQVLDLGGKTILPGLIDAHTHLYGYGLGLQNVDLVGTTSKLEVLQKLAAFENGKHSNFISGRGWDQNDWPIKEFPTKKELDSLFPETPVALRRIDGHALWVNSKALEMAGITAATKMEGVRWCFRMAALPEF